MFDSQRAHARIQAVAQNWMELSPPVAQDVAFHMVDWLDDLQAYVDFLRNPDGLDDEAAGQMLLGFLIHAPQHLAAAAKLCTGDPVTDIFEVGAVSVESP